MEDKNVQKLLDMLYGMIDEAKGATFSSEKCVINRDEALDLLDEIRNKLPGELSKAQELMKSREQYVDQANREVKRMVEQAKEDAGRILDRAQKEATQILEKAQEDAKTIVSESETIQRAQRRSSEIIPPQEFRDHSSGRGTQQGAVPRGQHLHRGCPAPDGGSHSGRPGRGAGVPRPLSQRLRRTDAGLQGEAQVLPCPLFLGGMNEFYHRFL